MDLEKVYDAVRPSVVAITAKYSPKRSETDPDPPYAPIIGTGFVVHADGLIATNDHVIRALPRLPRPPGTRDDEWPAHVHLFREIEGRGQLDIPIEIAGVAAIEGMAVEGVYYGPPLPDIGFIRVKCSGLPPLSIESDPMALREGREIATAGFPMGTEALTAPGYLHQLVPMLQKGVISAVLPFPCDTPHAFVANIMCQGGASGSPVFAASDTRVLGVLYAGLRDRAYGILEGSDHRVLVRVPTNFSYVVPGHFIQRALEVALIEIEKPEGKDVPTLDERIESEDWIVRSELGPNRPLITSEGRRATGGHARQLKPSD